MRPLINFFKSLTATNLVSVKLMGTQLCALLMLCPSLSIASPFDQTFENGVLKIPYLVFGGVAYEINLEIYENTEYSQCAILCLSVKSAEPITKIENTNNVSTFNDPELSLPLVKILDAVYSVQLRLIEGLSIFYVSNYSNLTLAKNYSTAELRDQFSALKNESFEGLQVEVLNTNSGKILVKPYMSMNVCTNDSQSTCYIQSPIYFYDLDKETFTFKKLENKVTNPNQFLVPMQWSYLKGDFNGDGNEDLVFATNGEFSFPPGDFYTGWFSDNYILLSNQDETYTWKLLNDFRGASRGLSAGDIDNDGDLDLYIDDAGELGSEDEYPGTQGGYFLINDGLANFTRATQRFVSATRSSLADFDNDGLLDLALQTINKGCQTHRNDSCRIFNGVYFYRNNGDLTFSEVTSDLPFTDEHSFSRQDDWVVKTNGVAYDLMEARSIAAMDVNKDGLLDLLVAVEGDYTYINLVSFLINKGNFNFELDLTRINHVRSKSQINGLKIIDANQDGHEDIYFLSKTGTTNSENKITESIYFNDGNGYFDNYNLLGLPDSAGMLTIRDVDSDGNLDIIKTDAYMRHYVTEDITEKKTTVYWGF